VHPFVYLFAGAWVAVGVRLWDALAWPLGASVSAPVGAAAAPLITVKWSVVRAAPVHADP